MTFLLAAISLGFLGSFHCIGMCGPIALALPVHTATPAKKVVLVLLYNLGRMSTYAILGLLAGLLGKVFVLAGYQQVLSISLGLLILFFLFFSRRFSGSLLLQSHIFSFFNRLKNKLGKLFQKKNQGSLFLIGVLNGLLPCGLVYMALAGAISTGDVWKGAAFMAVFGLGTVPVMLSLPLAGGVISVNARNSMRRTVPIILGVMALLLIVRGLNLGIPYLSPKINTPQQAVSCHPDSGKTIECHPGN